MRSMDQDWHQRKIPQHGNHPVGKMEPYELNLESGIIAAVAPRVVQVPDKIMHQNEFYSRGRGNQVMALCASFDKSESDELQGHTHGSHQIELPPADESSQGSGSCR